MCTGQDSLHAEREKGRSLVEGFPLSSPFLLVSGNERAIIPRLSLSTCVHAHTRTYTVLYRYAACGNVRVCCVSVQLGGSRVCMSVCTCMSTCRSALYACRSACGTWASVRGARVCFNSCGYLQRACVCLSLSLCVC